MTAVDDGAAGKRASRRCPCARWLSAALLFAAAPAAAQFNQNNPPRFAVELSKSTVVEGESVTVRLRCTVNYTAYRFEDQAGANRNHHLQRIDSAVADISISPVTLNGDGGDADDPQLSYHSFLQGMGPTSARLQER